MKPVTLSLISHTNVGKTTLARTLTRRDVGEVFDQAHVTEVSEAYPLIQAGGAELLLWDTPGLGDTVRLIKRLRKSGNPIGWFLHQIWDRNLDRPLWCSQEALRNVREDADAVLYVVNASESPEDAGYVTLELEILDWIGRPTMVVLNQTGPVGETAGDLEEEWRRFLSKQEIVRDVLSLDAFGRCWVQEDVLFDRVVALFEGDGKGDMIALAEAWRARNLETFQMSMELLADELAQTAADREELPGAFPSATQKEQAMGELGKRLEKREDRLWNQVIALHGLEGERAEQALAKIDSFLVTGEEKLTPKKGALLGSVVSGAIGGLTADIMSGGLSFGGGMLAGGILGALGGAGLTHAIQSLRTGEKPSVSWSQEFLDGLLERSILRYLAVAHFGRGRGRFEEEQSPSLWTQTLRSTLAAHTPRFHALWTEATETPAAHSRIARALSRDLQRTVTSVLSQAYPESRLTER